MWSHTHIIKHSHVSAPSGAIHIEWKKSELDVQDAGTTIAQ